MTQFAAQVRSDLAHIMGTVAAPGMGIAVLYRPVTAAQGAAGYSAVFEVQPLPMEHETGSMPGAQSGLRNPGATRVSQRWVVSAVAMSPGDTEVAAGAGVSAAGRIKQLKTGDTIEVPGAFVDGRAETAVLRISGKVRIDHGIYIAEAAL